MHIAHVGSGSVALTEGFRRPNTPTFWSATRAKASADTARARRRANAIAAHLFPHSHAIINDDQPPALWPAETITVRGGQDIAERLAAAGSS